MSRLTALLVDVFALGAFFGIGVLTWVQNGTNIGSVIMTLGGGLSVSFVIALVELIEAVNRGD